MIPIRLERGLNGSPLGLGGEKPGATKAGAPRNKRCQRTGTFKVRQCDWRFKDSGYAYLPGSKGERDLRRLVVIGSER